MLHTPESQQEAPKEAPPVKEKPSLREFMFNRLLNFVSALFSGIMLAFYFRFLGDWPNGAVKFLNDNFLTVSLVPNNWPGYAVLATVLLLACLFAHFAKMAVIIWDGVTFAVMSFAALSAVLMMLIGEMPTNDYPNGPWFSLATIILGGGIVYFAAMPYVVHEGLIVRNKAATYILGAICALILIAAFVLKTW